VIRYWQSGDYSVNNLKHGWMPPHPTFYVRRSVYEQHGGFDTSFQLPPIMTECCVNQTRIIEH